MSVQEVARILLSSEYARRRGYLSQMITTWNQVVIAGTLALWTLLVRWDALLGVQQNRPVFTTQIAAASAAAAILLGLWRFHARVLDDAIVRLYPVMYLCECVLVPPQAHTVPRPTNCESLSQQDAAGQVAWKEVTNSVFGGRWHHVFDWLAAGATVAFGALSVCTAVELGEATVSLRAPLNRVGYLLLGNLFGVLLILSGWLWWRNRKLNWPVKSTGAAGEVVSGLTGCS
jgi:hypothetical protein